MTPEDTVRTYICGGVASTSKAIAALDALVAERDALAARLAEAERDAFDRGYEEGVAYNRGGREAAEARVAALTEAVLPIYEAECKDWINHADPSDPDEVLPPWQGRWTKFSALAAADRTEDTTP